MIVKERGICEDEWNNVFLWRQEALSVGLLQTSHWSYKYCKLYVDRQTTETLRKKERGQEVKIFDDISPCFDI